MPALAEFLKGTVNDALTKVLQPAGLIPGALLVLLNLGIVFPRAEAENVGVVRAYDGLDAGVQVIVVSSLILVVGFLLLASSGPVLDTLAGRTWRMSLLATLLRAERNLRRKQLSRRIDRMLVEGSGADIERLDDLLWRRRTRTAPAERESTPTALGDVLLAAEHGIRARYGLSLPALWEPLRASLKPDDEAATATESAKSTLYLMANLTFASLLFVLEAVVVFTLFDDHSAVLAALAGLLVSYVAYRVTVAKAISWCDAIDTTVALHSAKLLDSLGMTAPTSGAGRRAALQRASDFMLRDEADDDMFGLAPVVPVTTTSPNLASSVTERQLRTPAKEADPADAHRACIAYSVFVAPADAGTPWTTGTLVFVDPRLPRIRETPAAAQRLVSIGEHAQESLTWQVTASHAGTAALTFELDRWRVAVDGDLTVTVQTLADAATRFVTVRNGTGGAVAGAMLSVFHTEDGVTHEVVVREGLVPAAPADGVEDRLFALPTLAAGATHRAVYALLERG